jgi:hypothetical protein
MTWALFIFFRMLDLTLILASLLALFLVIPVSRENMLSPIVKPILHFLTLWQMTDRNAQK